MKLSLNKLLAKNAGAQCVKSKHQSLELTKKANLDISVANIFQQK